MMNSKRSALLLRMGDYDVTQAVPRAAATLQEMGYDITILSMDQSCSKPDHEIVNGWHIYRYRYQYKPGSKLSFLAAWLNWWVWVIRKLRKHRYDLIQASNLESVFPCILIRKMRKFGLVFDVRDPWGMNHSNSRSLLMRAFKMMERWVAANVDGIVLSQGMLGRTGIYFGKKARRRTPIVQVLNVPGSDIVGEYRPPNLNGIRINFSGHISYIRNAQAIIDLAVKNPEVLVDVVGDISDEKLRSSLESISNVKLYGRLPYDQAMELLQEANLIPVMPISTGRPVAKDA